MLKQMMDPMADSAGRQLDPRWITVRRIRAALFLVVLAPASLTVVLVASAARGSLALGALLLLLWLVVIGALAWHFRRWPAVAYRHTSYRVDEDGLEIHRGVYWRTVTNVARSRIQHTDVSQGPLERRHGLGTLVVYTAGTAHSEVKLPGLEYGVAERIREHLLPRDRGDAV